MPLKAHIAQRLLTALACTLSVTSFLTPFLQAKWTGMTIPEAFPGPENYWSFRHTMQYSFLGTGSFYKEWWLADFWSQATYNSIFKEEFAQLAGPVFATMFLTQILTILLGSLSIITQKPLLFLSSTIQSAITIFLMLFITKALRDSYAKTLQAGFTLAVTSTLLFLAALVWKTTTRQQATQNTTSLTPPQTIKKFSALILTVHKHLAT